MIKSLLIALIVCGLFPFVCTFISECRRSADDPFGLGSIVVFIGSGAMAFVALILSTLVIIFTHVDKTDLPPPPKNSQEKITAPAVPEEKSLSEFGKWLKTPLIAPKDALPKE